MRLARPILFVVILCLGLVFSSRVQAKGTKNNGNDVEVCPPTKSPSIARCFSRVIVEDNTVTPFVSSLPSGYGPNEFRKAYGVSATASGTPIVAIVDAYKDANILSDLNTYSTMYGIPTLSKCSGAIKTSASSCFQVVGQTGTATLPTSSDGGWSLETALDVETVHAMCQNCKILLVEAKTPSMANLMKAVDTAVKLGADVISNSYGGSESPGDSAYDIHFNKKGIAITVSSGDSGYGVEYPAASRYVTAVGGTKLLLNSNGSYKSESAWSGAGSGCSAYETKPSWQTDTGCSKRTVADVSADADPSTGAAVYSSALFNGSKGWMEIGGTSLAAPLVAGVYALAGKVPATQYGNNIPYLGGAATLHDITSGSNGACTHSYLCHAVSGYDGPTGLGSPKGLGAF